MEIGAGGGQAGHLDRLASPSISPVLEVEVATGQAPRIQQDLRQLIAQWVRANPTWGEQRVADELWLKLGIKVAPRTVRAYWPQGNPPRSRRLGSQNWNTFVRNHARALLARDFMVAVTASIFYIFVVIEVGKRRLVHCGITANPTAERSIQHSLRCWRLRIHLWRYGDSVSKAQRLKGAKYCSLGGNNHRRVAHSRRASVFAARSATEILKRGTMR